MEESPDGFYITGGTLPLDADSYVVRAADAQLLDGLRRGEFCYVLNTRQMGKSSLMVRTALQLRADGCRVAILDLTAIGQNLTVEQWYFGLLTRTAAQTRRTEDLVAFWKANRDLGPMQRFIEALRQVLLSETRDGAEGGRAASNDESPFTPSENSSQSRLVVFVDEIDAVRSLQFSADEFFAGIRECYNRRPQDPAFERLTFCLAGVATPTDLVQDTRISPFNIGRRIELKDFTAEEAAGLTEGFARAAESNGRRTAGARAATAFAGRPALQRVLYWTNGHPYMTQRLCQAIAAAGTFQAAEIDTACERLFLIPAARETDDNLAFVRNRILSSEADLTRLLTMFERIRCGRRVRDDETNPLCSILRLSGIARIDPSGNLRTRNRIYERVFDRAWVRDNLPDAEMRRQREAFRRGVLRTSLLSAIVGLALCGLVVLAIVNAREAQRNASAAKMSALLASDNAARADENAKRADENAAIARASAAHMREALAQADRSAMRAHEAAVHADIEARRAEAGERKAREATTASQVANSNARSRLSQSYIDRGTLLEEGGDHAGALAPFAEAMALDRDDPARLAMHRRRFAATEAQAPRIERLWTADGPVVWASYSPDKKWIAAVDSGGKARVWRAGAGATLPIVFQHPSGAKILYAAFSPRSRLLATCGTDGCARIWSLDVPRVVAVLCARPEVAGEGTRSIIRVAWSHDGTQVATNFETDRGDFLLLWKLALGTQSSQSIPSERSAAGNIGGTLISKTSDVEMHITDFDFAPNDRRIAVVSSNYIALSLAVPALTVLGSFDSAGVGGCYIGRRVIYNADGRRVLIAGVFGGHAERQGACLLAGNSDGDANQEAGKPKNSYLPDDEAATDGAFSPDGKRVVTASLDGTARVWDVATGQPLMMPIEHDSPVLHTEFSADGRRILTACGDGTVRVWDARTGGLCCPPIHNAGAVAAARFGQDSSHVMTASADTTVRLWLLPELTPQSAASHTQLSNFRVSPNTDLLLEDSKTGEKARVLRLIKVSNGQIIKESGAQFPFTGWEPSVNQRRVLLGNEGRTGTATERAKEIWTTQRAAQVWNIRAIQPVSPRFAADYAELSHDGSYVLLIYRDRTFRLAYLNEQSGLRVSTALKGEIGEYFSVNCSSFTPDDRSFLLVDSQNKVRLLGTRTLHLVVPPMPHESPVQQWEFSPDGRYLFTITMKMVIRVWNVASGTLACLPIPAGEVFVAAGAHDITLRACVFSPNGRIALTGGLRHVCLWRLREARLASVRLDRLSSARCVFSSDSRSFFAIGAREWLWDAETARPIRLAAGSGITLAAAAYSPDSRHVAAVGEDGSVRIWDARTGKPTVPPLRAAKTVQAAYSPDGSMVATASEAGLVRVWDAATGEALTPRFTYDGYVNQIQFSDDDRRLIVSCESGVSLRTLPVTAESVESLQARALLLSGQRTDPSIGDVPAEPSALRAAYRQISR